MKVLTYPAYEAWLGSQSAWLQAQGHYDDDECDDPVEEYVNGVVFYSGNQCLDVISPAPMTVVDGDLVVNQLSHEFNSGKLVVTGNLRVPTITRMDIDIVVGGDLHAHMLCLNTSNDYGLSVGGDLMCDYFAEYGCHVEVGGKIICPLVLNMMNSIRARGGLTGKLLDRRGGSDVDDLLVEPALYEQTRFSEDGFIAQVLKGLSPYRS